MNPINDSQAQVRQASSAMDSALTRRANPGGQAMGKEDFLNLLMAQVTHQDPLNPMDSQGMMNQLTSMGSLEQMINMNKQLDKLGQLQADVAQANAYTFLDKDVTLKGGVVSVAHGGAAGLQYQIPREAHSVQVQILGTDGNVVRTLDLGQQAPGRHVVNWDAHDKDGDPVANGSYQYNVTAKSEDNQPLPVQLFSKGKVSGIRFDNGRTLLKVNGDEVDARGILEISNQSQHRFGDRQPLPLREGIPPLPAREREKP